MSVIKTKQKSYTSLTIWIEFYASNVNNGNQAKKLHITHNLDEIHTGNISNGNQAEDLHTTDFLDIDNISNGNQAKNLHMTDFLHRLSYRECQKWKSSKGPAHNSRSGWNFMHAISEMEIKQRICT